MDLEKEFGEGVIDRFATVLAEDTAQHVASGRYLRAAFSAVRYVVLAGRHAWSEDDQQSMADAVREELTLRLRANDWIAASWRAAYYRTLTDETAWDEEQTKRFLEAAGKRPEGEDAWRRASFAASAADYLVLGGRPFWDDRELSLMLEAVKDDFGDCVKRGEELLAAERLALFSLLAGSLD